MPRPKKTSRYRGVTANPGKGSPWLAVIRHVGRPARYLGPFATEETAARAYDDHYKDQPGFKRIDLNFPPEDRRVSRAARRPATKHVGVISLRQRVIARCRELTAVGIHPTLERLAEDFPGSDRKTLSSYRADSRACVGGLMGETPKARAEEIRALNEVCIKRAEKAERKRLDRLRRGPAPDRWAAMQAPGGGR